MLCPSNTIEFDNLVEVIKIIFLFLCVNCDLVFVFGQNCQINDQIHMFVLC